MGTELTKFTREDRQFRSFRECNGGIVQAVEICQEDGDVIKVEIGSRGVYQNAYSEANSVASQASATVINYTVPVGKIFNLKSVDYSSDCIGNFTLEVNGNTQSKQYTNYTKYSGKFDFLDFDLIAGDNLKLIIENKSNGIGNFNANFQGRLRDV